MKSSFPVVITALGFISSISLAQTDPGVTPGRITPTTPTAPAATTVEKTAPEAEDSRAQTTPKGTPMPLKKGAKFAMAKLESRSGSNATGTVTFTKETDGIRIAGDFAGVAEGKHGFHIHEKGDCSAPDASSAGGHFNPSKAPHGDPKAKERHAGDFGNLEVRKDGKASMKIKVSDPKDFNAWSEIAGKAVILHEKADDLKTQPTGDAGGRIACGVIEMTPSNSH
jgi:Cu-Zn family superoxide dismutase